MHEAIPSDLPSRIVFSLLRGAVRLASRMGLPLKQVVQLVRLAYYQELRESHPRDRKAIAAKLGISLRTAAELGSQMKTAFTEPEETVMFSRRVRQRIDDQPTSTPELLTELDADPAALDAVLQTLVFNGWIELFEGRWRVRGAIQSYLGGSLIQKVDGLNRLQDVVSDAAWASFFGDPTSTTTARTWVFHADPQAFTAFRDESIRSLRGQTVELDEQALASADASRVGVTVVFSRMTP